MNRTNQLEQEQKLYQQLRQIMLRSERLWLLDCDGCYETYRQRLRALARDYKIPVPDEK